MESSNKRIAKNTVMLYIRMIITMFIGLFTSRIILNALGVDDYGIYNVVGGFVSLFSLVSASMSGSISRFITFELGRGDEESSRNVFATSITVQIALSAIVVLLSETIGLWFLYNKMVIPDERMYAAQWVFQLSIISFVIGLISVPYNAAVVAHEEMGKFAFFSIFESIFRLAIALIVRSASCDKLILYAVLGCVVSWAMRYLYLRFCKKNFAECTFKYSFDKVLFRKIFGFAGWNGIGTCAAILRSQGGTLLLNIFGGTAVNAAAGVAATLTGVVESFVGNFTTAYNPQITKSYASGDYNRLHTLLFLFSRLSYFMMLFFALPVAINAQFVLSIWLGNVPAHTANFVQLVICFMLIETLAKPLIIAKNATGNIRNYQLVVGSVLLFTFPIAWLSLWLGAPVESVFVADVVTSILAFVARMLMLVGDIPHWSSLDFTSKVIVRVLWVTLLASIVPIMIVLVMDEGWTRVLVSSFISVMMVGLIAFYVGFSSSERQMVLNILQPLYSRFIKKEK